MACLTACMIVSILMESNCKINVSKALPKVPYGFIFAHLNMKQVDHTKYLPSLNIFSGDKRHSSREEGVKDPSVFTIRESSFLFVVL